MLIYDEFSVGLYSVKIHNDIVLNSLRLYTKVFRGVTRNSPLLTWIRSVVHLKKTNNQSKLIIVYSVRRPDVCVFTHYGSINPANSVFFSCVSANLA